ncbi:hypothetical protein Mapa_015326 [Marchantia paleacea]|nr:hypothetical protein Mapa_015326 [Marchantia paleacea]
MTARMPSVAVHQWTLRRPRRALQNARSLHCQRHECGRGTGSRSAVVVIVVSARYHGRQGHQPLHIVRIEAQPGIEKVARHSSVSYVSRCRCRCHVHVICTCSSVSASIVSLPPTSSPAALHLYSTCFPLSFAAHLVPRLVHDARSTTRKGGLAA